MVPSVGMKLRVRSRRRNTNRVPAETGSGTSGRTPGPRCHICSNGAKPVYRGCKRGAAACGIVEAGARNRIECQSQPVADQDDAERDPLLASRPEGQQEEQDIAQPDLA